MKPTKQKTKVVLYASDDWPTKEWESNSSKGQLKELNEYCRKNNLEVVKEYTEFNIRPFKGDSALKRLLKGLRKERVNADFVLITTWEVVGGHPRACLEFMGSLKRFGASIKPIRSDAKSEIYNPLKYLNA